jgi:hypothetical protein
VDRHRGFDSARQLRDLDADEGSNVRALPMEHLDERPDPLTEQSDELPVLPREHQDELPVPRRCLAESDSGFDRVRRHSPDLVAELVGRRAASMSRDVSAMPAHLSEDRGVLGPTLALLRELATGSGDRDAARLPRLDWGEPLRERCHRALRRRPLPVEDR